MYSSEDTKELQIIQLGRDYFQTFVSAISSPLNTIPLPSSLIPHLSFFLAGSTNSSSFPSLATFLPTFSFFPPPRCSLFRKPFLVISTNLRLVSRMSHFPFTLCRLNLFSFSAVILRPQLFSSFSILDLLCNNSPLLTLPHSVTCVNSTTP